MQLIFILLCFIGIVFMFFCIQRGQERIQREMQAEFEQIRAMVMELSTALGDDADAVLRGEPAAPRSQLRTSTPVASAEDMELLPSSLPKGTTVEQASAMLRAGGFGNVVAPQVTPPVAERGKLASNISGVLAGGFDNLDMGKPEQAPSRVIGSRSNVDRKDKNPKGRGLPDVRF